jgi:hypothetical protein
MEIMMWLYYKRIISRLTGQRPTLSSRGRAQIIGQEVEGGYYDISSPDLPGFRFMLDPEEAEDIGKMTAALSPALDAYLDAYVQAQDRHERMKALISQANLGRRGRPINLVAELCGCP